MKRKIYVLLFAIPVILTIFLLRRYFINEFISLQDNPIYFVENIPPNEYIPIHSFYIKGPLTFQSEEPNDRGQKAILYQGEGAIDLYHIEKLPHPSSLGKNIQTFYTFSFGVHADVNTMAYLLIRSSNGVKVWLNDEYIFQSKNMNRSFEAAFSDFITLPLHNGVNNILIEHINLSEELVFEARLCNRDYFLTEYGRKYTGLIGEPLHLTDTFYFDTNHRKILNVPVTLSIQDISGKNVFEKELSEKEDYLLLASLKEDATYMCNLQSEGITLRQPIYKGDPDKIWKAIQTKQHPEMNAYAYRIKALLEHESRQSDWWWRFKIASVLFEADLVSQKNSREYNFAHTSGICFRSYKSSLDSCDQHYLLILPDSVDIDSSIPLVIIPRPFIDNQHHFLISPQMARYWSLTHAKALANEYNYILMMPEARMYAHEDLVPMAAAEIINSIEDVKEHYPVDESRIYLQGNCSGAYRSLSLLSQYPGMFAACALYSPLNSWGYKTKFQTIEWVNNQKPENLIPYIKQIPLFIQYDELDMHNPYITFKGLIDKIQNSQDEVTIIGEKHSGAHYNVLLVGENAFEFFKNKRLTQEMKESSPFLNTAVVADIFSQPYLFVYEKGNEHATQYITHVKANYEKNFWNKFPVCQAEDITKEDIETKNLILIGHSFRNELLRTLMSETGLQIKNNSLFINNELKATSVGFQIITKNPWNKNLDIVVISASDPRLFNRLDREPWKNGLLPILLLYK
ncbi:MAG: hypothetical protein LUH10_13305 [Tannerellaceae bacterium]|nr:hypothetical protein [Tannerellaceae bacterium]